MFTALRGTARHWEKCLLSRLVAGSTSRPTHQPCGRSLRRKADATAKSPDDEAAIAHPRARACGEGLPGVLSLTARVRVLQRPAAGACGAGIPDLYGPWNLLWIRYIKKRCAER